MVHRRFCLTGKWESAQSIVPQPEDTPRLLTFFGTCIAPQRCERGRIPPGLGQSQELRVRGTDMSWWQRENKAQSQQALNDECDKEGSWQFLSQVSGRQITVRDVSDVGPGPKKEWTKHGAFAL